MEHVVYIRRAPGACRYETAYQATQGTKPDTLAVGLHDSPAALLVWILEKVHTWSDCHRAAAADGSPAPGVLGEWERAVSIDDLLLNVMVYVPTWSGAPPRRTPPRRGIWVRR